MPSTNASTPSSTPDTKLQEFDLALRKLDRARLLYLRRMERAEKLAAELGREIQPRLPLGDD